MAQKTLWSLVVVLSASAECVRGEEPLLEIPAVFDRSSMGWVSPGDLVEGAAQNEREPLVTDRPDFTEASSVVGRGVVQLESGYTFFYRDDEQTGELTRAHSGPETLWRVGITEDVELRLAWNYVWERTIGDGAAENIDGALDLYLGAKIALFDEEEFRPEAALVLQGTVPTGAAAFTNDEVSVGANLLYSWGLPNDWSLGGSTGVNTAVETVGVGGAPPTPFLARDGFVVFHQSVALGIPLTDKVGMYVEYFGLYSAGRDSNFPTNFVDGGFTYLLNNDVQLDVRAGKGLNDQADDLFAGAGIAIRF